MNEGKKGLLCKKMMHIIYNMTSHYIVQPFGYMWICLWYFVYDVGWVERDKNWLSLTSDPITDRIYFVIVWHEIYVYHNGVNM